MINGAVDGNGVKPCSGRTEGRTGRRDCHGGERVARIAVTYRKVGEGRAFNGQSWVPFLKGWGAGRPWVSWSVTRPPQQLHSLRNQLRRSGGGRRNNS